MSRALNALRASDAHVRQLDPIDKESRGGMKPKSDFKDLSKTIEYLEKLRTDSNYIVRPLVSG